MKIIFSYVLTLVFILMTAPVWAQMEAPPTQEKPAAEPAVEAVAEAAEPAKEEKQKPEKKIKEKKVKEPKAKKVKKEKKTKVVESPVVENTETGAATAPTQAPTTVSEPAPAVAEPAKAPEEASEPTPAEAVIPATTAPTAEPVGPTYTAVYRSGAAPLKLKSKVTISKKGDAYQMAAKEGPAWEIPVKEIRGAQASATGLWFYWFDSTGSTQVAFFELKGAAPMASEINNAVAAYHQAQNSDEKYRADYEAYKEKALQESK